MFKARKFQMLFHMKTHSMLLESRIQQRIKITVGDQVGWLEQHKSLNMTDNPKSMKDKNRIISCNRENTPDTVLHYFITKICHNLSIK